MITGKIIPYILWTQVQFFLFLIIGKLIFKVHFTSVILLCFVLIPFSLCGFYLGVISSLLMSSMAAAISLGTGLLLIQVIFSGLLFPVYGMPLACQYISSLMPLSHFLVVLRALGIKGASFYSVIWDIMYIIISAIILNKIVKRAGNYLSS